MENINRTLSNVRVDFIAHVQPNVSCKDHDSKKTFLRSVTIFTSETKWAKRNTSEQQSQNMMGLIAE